MDKKWNHPLEASKPRVFAPLEGPEMHSWGSESKGGGGLQPSSDRLPRALPADSAWEP